MDLLTITDVSDRLQVSESTVRRFIREGELRPVVLPGSRLVRVTEKELQRFLDKSSQGQNQ